MAKKHTPQKKKVFFKKKEGELEKRKSSNYKRIVPLSKNQEMQRIKASMSEKNKNIKVKNKEQTHKT